MAFEPLPIVVLTGFLGSGKTTFLRRVLASPGMADTAVVVNEFGEIGLDHLLLEASPDEVVVLGSGCLCCAVRQDLVRTLYRLLARRAEGSLPPFRRIAVETSGLAEPAPILATLAADAHLEATLRLAGVLTVVDAVAGLATLDRHAEATAQAVIADRLLLTKTDLAAPSAALLERLAAINPAAEIIESSAPPDRFESHLSRDAREVAMRSMAGEGPRASPLTPPSPPAKLRGEREMILTTAGVETFDPASLLFAPAGAATRRPIFAAPTEHTHGIASFAIALHRPMTRLDFAKALGGLARTRGEDLLRVKGIVRFADRPDRSAVIHAVQHTLYPPEWLERTPPGAMLDHVVFIVRGIAPADVLASFGAGAAALVD